MEGNTEGKNSAKEISDRIGKYLNNERYENSPAGVTERYMNDIRSYLYSKMEYCINCSCTTTDILDEIAVYCANRMTVSMVDALNERDREWKAEIKRQERAARVLYKKGRGE